MNPPGITSGCSGRSCIKCHSTCGIAPPLNRGVEPVEKPENEAIYRTPEFFRDFLDADRASRLRQRRRSRGGFDVCSDDDVVFKTIVAYIASH